MTALPRVLRAMIGTGLTFGIAVGAIVTAVGTVATLFGKASFLGSLRIAGRMSVASFILGIIFSAILAGLARSRRFGAISIGRFALLGVGAGLVYFGALSINAAHVWSVGDAIRNLVILTVLGGGSAAGTLALARRGSQGRLSAEEQNVIEER
jgi:hypothetical protein